MAPTHFYTAGGTEWQAALLKAGKCHEGVSGYVFTRPAPGLGPLFRAYRPATGAHFYTMNAVEHAQAVHNLGYVDEGVTGYLGAQQSPGMVALHRAYHAPSDDHFYTTDLAEHQNAVADLGYTDEGVTGWVHPAQAPGTVALHRMYGPQTRTFRQDLTSMAGWVQVDIDSSGGITFSGHVHNDAIIAEAFQFRVRVVLGGACSFLMEFTGSVGGTGASPQQRNCYWTQTENRCGIAANFLALDKVQVFEDRKGAITGTLIDIGTFVDTLLEDVSLQVTVTALNEGLIAFALAEAIGYASGNGAATSQIVQGVLWLKGPEGGLNALAADGLASLGRRRRPISAEEYAWANEQVFAGTLPVREQIYLTDSDGPGGLHFTFPEVGGLISVNLGADYDNPMASSAASTFLHELTHAWQIARTPFPAVWMAQELAAQLQRSTAYDLPPAGPPFDTFNPEQQAMIVQRWYENGQQPGAQYHDYHVYIDDNIRAGKPGHF